MAFELELQVVQPPAVFKCFYFVVIDFADKVKKGGKVLKWNTK